MAPVQAAIKNRQGILTVLYRFSDDFFSLADRTPGPAERKGDQRRPRAETMPLSRSARLRASLRARRIASAFSRARRSEGFSYALRCFISRKMPSRCILFLRTLRAWSTLLSRTCIST